jgi:putative two-component system response regulator
LLFGIALQQHHVNRPAGFDAPGAHISIITSLGAHSSPSIRNFSNYLLPTFPCHAYTIDFPISGLKMLQQSHQPITGTILVADDQASNRELLHELLTPQGFQVVSVSDGAAVLEQLTRTQVDLVLLDVMMPHLNGFEVCEKIKGDPGTYLIPVILITALSDKQDRLEGIKAGADDFLSRPVDRTELLARVRSLLKLKQRTDELERAESVLFSLARSIEGKDPYTLGHCERLAEYSARLGEHLGLSEEQLIALRRAGVVHDVGKIAVPDAILLKPGSLTEEEWKLIREHPAVGERICAPLKSFRLVLPIIRHHHERCDGSGYPDGLRAEAIPVTARVLQIVDVYDALTTDRPYRKALSITDALQTMKHEVAKGWWDPQIFEQFERLVRSGAAEFLSRGAVAGR